MLEKYLGVGGYLSAIDKITAMDLKQLSLSLCVCVHVRVSAYLFQAVVFTEHNPQII